MSLWSKIKAGAKKLKDKILPKATPTPAPTVKQQIGIAPKTATKPTSTQIIESAKKPVGGTAPIVAQAAKNASTPIPEKKNFAQKIHETTQAFAGKVSSVAEKGISAVTSAISPNLEAKRVAMKEQNIAGTDMVAGTVPLSPAAGLAAIKSVSTNLLARAGLAGKKASIARTATMFGKDTATVEKAVKAMQYRSEVTKTVKGLSVGKLVGTLIGVDILTNWYALDNVIGGQKFYIKDIAAGVADGSINPIDGQKAVAESQATRDIAISKVKMSSIVDPAIWPFRKLMLTGMEADEEAIKLYEDAINAAADAAKAGGVEGSPPVSEYEQGIIDWKAAKDQERIDDLAATEETIRLWNESKAANRKAEAEYYAAVLEASKKRREEEQIENDKYWAKVKKDIENTAPSKLGFGLV